MNLDLIDTDDDEVAPVRTAAVLREDVRQRVQRARRRRRLRQATMSSALVGVLAVLLVARTPAPSTTVRTPASEGRQDQSDEYNEPDAPDGQVEQGGGTAPSGPGAAVPGNTATTVVAALPTPPSVPDPFPRPVEKPRDKSTEVFRSADVRLAAIRMYEVWELGADWSPTRKLISNANGHVTEIEWAPDGRQLAYRFNYWTATRNTTSIRILDLASMQSRIVAESSDFAYYALSYSADGTMLAFDRGPTTTSVASGLHFSIVVVDLDAPPGSDRWEFGPGDMPSWMPDGRILFRCERELCISDARGGNRVRVPNSDKAYHPEVSPDGNWVAFSTSDTGLLQIMRIDGSERRPLADSTSYDGAHWSPDGRRIFYTTNYGIRTIARDGSDLRIVTERRDEGGVAVTRR